ncbi:MAG: response regulator [Limnochordia bacterium]|jgi:two-component system chemotaxis response regulator CheY
MAKTVLIVDDTAFMRMTIKNVVQKGGYEVIGEAADGEEAIAKYMELKPDLVTMDITMPKLDGISAIKAIVAKDPQARIIVCSAMGQKAMVIEALKAGAKDFLVKPFEPERVLEALQKASV